MGLFEFEASLVSRVSSRTARAVIQRNPVLKKKKKKKERKRKEREEEKGEKRKEKIKERKNQSISER